MACEAESGDGVKRWRRFGPLGKVESVISPMSASRDGVKQFVFWRGRRCAGRQVLVNETEVRRIGVTVTQTE